MSINGNSAKGSFQKRLEQLERVISLKRPQHIVVLFDPDNEDRTALDAILQDVAPTPDDLLILLKCFGGGAPTLPWLLSVESL